MLTVSAGRSQAWGSSDQRRGTEGLGKPMSMASNRQRHQPDRHTVREEVMGQSNGLVRVHGVRECLLQRDHLAVDLVKWDTKRKREAIKSISKDTSLAGKYNGDRRNKGPQLH